MTRRRNTINIYDYPEHLNPFREDVDDNCDKFNTTGRRRPSLRVNAWAMFSQGKGNKTQTAEDITPQPSAASRFMTWTPKLLRRSFRRSSPSSSSPWDSAPHSSSRLSFRTPSSRTSLPPPGSSRTSLPPPSSSPSHRTAPPSRPAPPNFHPPLSPSSKENGPNNIEINPVPPRRRALYTASPQGKTAGEKPPEDEVKYIQQGAKPKKKRRAPLPPQPSPSKSPSDSHLMNSDGSEVSVTTSSTSNVVDESTSQRESPTTGLDVKSHASEDSQQKDDQEQSVSAKEETPENGHENKSENSSPEEHVQNGVADEAQKLQEETKVEEPPISENGSSNPNNLTKISVNGVIQNTELEEPADNGSTSQEPENRTAENDEADTCHSITKAENNNDAKGAHLNGMNGRHNSDECLKVDFDVVLHISEEDLRDKGNSSEKLPQNHTENGTNNLDGQEQENKDILQNGDKTLNDSEELQNETELNDKNMKLSPMKTPAPKPRTILPMKD